jgi:hypothetical protein
VRNDFRHPGGAARALARSLAAGGAATGGDGISGHFVDFIL